ncbi:uncharacterized protein LOC103494023 [Cucumis melo]|uniref:Uncharacterized protein LOC103494023 n=1 Tax=Cucumis melo TaxID=3656 RepID=A0A1S3BWX8_CUCME|nr:uncharacterized protein LOC103494023 [Cucumis melo]
MAFSYSSQLQTLFLILLVVHPALGNPETQQWIDRICYQNEDYGFCNKTSNENLKGPADDVGLVLIANNQVLRNTSRTYQFIVELQASTDDPVTKTALEACRIAPRGEASCRPPTPDSPLVKRKRELRILIAMAAVAGHVLPT